MGFWQRNARECISGSSHDLSTPPMLAVKLQSARMRDTSESWKSVLRLVAPCLDFPPDQEI